MKATLMYLLLGLILAAVVWLMLIALQSIQTIGGVR